LFPFIFRTCTPIKDSIENELDMASFFENLAGNFAGVVQYNKDNSPHATVTIDDVRQPIFLYNPKTNVSNLCRFAM